MNKRINIKKLIIGMAAALACSTGVNAINHAVQIVPTIDGYVAVDSDGSREGFKVEVENKLTVYTSANGYYKLNNDSPVFTKTIKISKKGHLARYVKGLEIRSNATVGTADAPLIMYAGDVNGDDTINMNDIVLMAKAFNSTLNDIQYNDAADINSDKTVNMTDVVIVAKNFNKSSGDYGMPTIDGGEFIEPSWFPSPTNTPANTPTNTPTPYVTTVASAPATYL